MPDMESTGPYGTGPIGRGFGPCGDGEPGSRGRHFSHRGFHYGRGQGWGRMFPFASPEGEQAFLEGRKKWLETQIEAINQRLESLNKSKEAQ